MMRKALVQARGPRGQPILKSCLPSTLALGEGDGKGTSLAYYPGMTCQNGNPPLRAFLWFVPVLPGLVLCSSTGLPGEKRRDLGLHPSSASFKLWDLQQEEASPLWPLDFLVQIVTFIAELLGE